MNLSFDERPVLIISPHADDWFLGCLAVMYRTDKGKVLVFSGSGWENEQAQVTAETNESWKRARTGDWTIKLYPFYARKLEESRTKILDLIFNEISDYKPGTLLLPGGAHQDHETSLREGNRAALNARGCTILYYFPNIKDHTIYGMPIRSDITLMLGDEVAKMKHDVFEDVWESQHHRREYCQLGDRELYALGRHVQ